MFFFYYLGGHVGLPFLIPNSLRISFMSFSVGFLPRLKRPFLTSHSDNEPLLSLSKLSNNSRISTKLIQILVNDF